MTGSMDTPWGVALKTQQLDEGVYWVETADHGGILIENTWAKTVLSEKAQHIGKLWHDFLTFEQAHDMMVVFYEHPEWYPWIEEELAEKLAEDSLRQHHPEYFTC
ncbi:MAG TPA: hypothetical protein VKR06_36945 [Ktedonosporobacter sp.]|nr:hypothetical protein [Ktedonosporobacter sp.]